MPSNIVVSNIPELSKLITDEIFKKLLENCFSVLIGNREIHTLTAIADSKLDVIKEFYAVLLSISANFVTNDTTKDEIQQRLSKTYNWSINRINLYLEEFQKHKIGIQTSLVNIGTHFPSIVDVKWKIDYIIQSSIVSETDGPMFRICLVTEKYDTNECGKKLEYINFTCDSQEMQDLIYKLKDAVRHCQSVANRIS